MRRKRKEGPKGSEISVGEWLVQIGATNIQYVGAEAGGGPPDWVMEYEGEEVAVEVCLLHDTEGWNKKEQRRIKTAFEKELRELIEEESARGETAPRWHACCEYDPRECTSSIRNREEWRKEARTALRTQGPGGEFQLISKEKRKGRGVKLVLMPASNEGGFSGVSADQGLIVEMTLSEQIVSGMKEKADKVREGKRAREYDRWWLVFDDEILIAPIAILTREEQDEIEARVRDCPGREVWSKIVLMSRFQAVPPPQKTFKWFYSLWEDSFHPSLPTSSHGLTLKGSG